MVCRLVNILKAIVHGDVLKLTVSNNLIVQNINWIEIKSYVKTDTFSYD